MSKEHILLVEDEPDLLQTLSFNFESEGYKVSKALNGEEAMKLLEKNDSIALVILDLMLPDISGLDICRHIRNTNDLQNLLVIMVTAKGEEVDRVVGFEVGADDYVVKPYSVRELLLRVGGMLKRSSKEKDEIDKEVIVFEDDNRGSCISALEQIKLKFPNDKIIFCNGGDRNKDNIPEMVVENIDFKFNVGGQNKKNS